MANVVDVGRWRDGQRIYACRLPTTATACNLVGTHLDADIIEEIHETRTHPRLKSRLRDSVTPYTYDRLGEALQGVELVVLGVNSLGVEVGGRCCADTLPPARRCSFSPKGWRGEGDAAGSAAAPAAPSNSRRRSSAARQAVGRRRPLDRRRAGRQSAPHLRRCHRR
jgi:hypothetical protein